MALHLLHDPLPVVPVPCGSAEGDTLVKAWQTDRGRAPGERPEGTGVCTVEPARREFASVPFTLECWVTWPEGTPQLREPAVVAEAAGDGWTWSFGFDHVGALIFVRRFGDRLNVVASDLLIDSVLPGRWYHAAVVVTHDGRCGLYFTEAGHALARRTGEVRKLELPGGGPGGAAALSLGRRIAAPDASALHVGSAALHAAALGPAEFPALGGAELPAGLVVDQEMEYGSVGRVFGLSEDTLAFGPGKKESTWYAFRLRGAKGRTLRFCYLTRGQMGVAVTVSEDGGRTWGHPNGGAWRCFDDPELVFTHTFASDEAIFAASPPVTVAMADEWIDRAAKRFAGRIHDVGTSREGRPLRVLEVGNPDAPMIYLQAGQHNMMERMGFFMITSALEAASGDADLMARTRWLVMPLVNVDSYSVCTEDGNMNRFWGKDAGPPTIRALCRFLRREAERTGGLVMGDWHCGTVFRGHMLLCETARGYSDPTGYWESLNVSRESGYPEFEAAMHAEGLDYTVLNGYARNLAGLRQHGYFEDFVMALPGVTAPLCIELSSITARTPEGAEPVSPDALRADGVRWYRAISRYVSGES